MDESIQRAAAAIAEAEALVFSAGAGMGVDSGLPDFRGNEGFWNAYPPYGKLGLSFVDLANPEWFATDPTMAWGFYGHRANLYAATSPHAGFSILRNWAERVGGNAFVFTSNVDGAFQKAGFSEEQIVEVHGSCSWLQCMASCGVGIFPAAAAGNYPTRIDAATMRAAKPLPSCPNCGELARPNILMFGDWHWVSHRANAQHHRLRHWLESNVSRRLIVVECGAGTAIPTVRHFSEDLVRTAAARLIRINLREANVPSVQIGIPLGAREGIERIDTLLQGTFARDSR